MHFLRKKNKQQKYWIPVIVFNLWIPVRAQSVLHQMGHTVYYYTNIFLKHFKQRIGIRSWQVFTSFLSFSFFRQHWSYSSTPHAVAWSISGRSRQSCQGCCPPLHPALELHQGLLAMLCRKQQWHKTCTAVAVAPLQTVSCSLYNAVILGLNFQLRDSYIVRCRRNTMFRRCFSWKPHR